MRFDFNIKDSLVDISRVVAGYTSGDDIGLPHIRAYEVARSAVDCLAFVDGIGLTLVLEEMITPAGVVSKVLAHNKALAPLCTAFSKSPDARPEQTLEAMLKLVMREAPLFLALNDLISTATIPGQVAVNCGRAIEGLRVIMVPLDPTRKVGWTMLQDHLNITRSYREFITNTSTGARHGDRTDIPGIVAQQVIERAWVIKNRFLEYRKRGNLPLPADAFPLLS